MTRSIRRVGPDRKWLWNQTIGRYGRYGRMLSVPRGLNNRPSTTSRSHGWGRRALDTIHHGRVTDVCVAVTSLAGYGAAFVDGLDLTGASAVTLHIAREARITRRCFPGGHRPHGASKGFELKSFLSPLAAWLARAVERSQSRVDCSRIGLGTELVRRYRVGGSSRAVCAVDCAIGTVKVVSMLYRHVVGMHRFWHEGTHSLGFFLGPGRPLSFMGALGSMDGGARLRPDAAAPPLFLLPSVLGGASVLASAGSLPAGGMGVALEADSLSAASEGGIDGEASSLTIVGDGRLSSDGKRDRASGATCRVTSRLFLADLTVDLVRADISAGDGIVLDGRLEQRCSRGAEDAGGRGGSTACARGLAFVCLLALCSPASGWTAWRVVVCACFYYGGSGGEEV